jgi:AraC family transcriptional regulator
MEVHPMQRFQPVLDFIEASLDRKLAVSDLASLVGLSAPRFSHAFKDEVGVAPYRYVLERRVARARELLPSKDCTIATIASEVGFSSQSRFSQCFLRCFGTTPSAYRYALNRGVL